MPWVTRGLSDGIVTTRYPRRPDGYDQSYHGAIRVLDSPSPTSDGRGPHLSELPALCPTGAISDDGSRLRVDRGACILCGRCVERYPERFAFDPSVEVASRERTGLVVPDAVDDDQAIARTRAELAGRVRALRRSVHIRHVDAGSDGSEEWEIAALNNPVYDVQRLGIFFTASPRHADLLLVTGAGTAGMSGPLRTTWEGMPDPKIVIAAGTDAASGGLVHPTYATRGGVGAIVAVDVWVPGSPPSPFALLHGILLGLGLLPGGGR
ncbi:MAG: ferredoxin [Acidimicrobiaceae bacterium]|nr:ferredoxin [Acidimicrobiaceae bacterium]MBO0747926.1 ferredoxin [Acidimicrobiaceae bacterium]